MERSKKRNFAVFILTNGRPDRVYTYKTLKKCGYTGRTFLIVDDLDKTGSEYRERYGEQVVVFDKKDIARRFDAGDNFNDMRAVFYARNACFDIAKKLGVEYFIQLDDDYTDFAYRFNNEYEFKHRHIKNLDRVFELMCQLYDRTGALTVAMAQGGDFVGGSESDFARKVTIKRKAMNSFICSVNRPFEFVGRINEDVNTYLYLGRQGKLIYTVNVIALNQKTTQKNKGGMSEMYLDTGTYLKSFYSIMYAPSCCEVSIMKTRHRRIHHKINWNMAVPKIISEEYGSN